MFDFIVYIILYFLEADMNKARDHLYKMTNEGSCKTPIRKVIPIQNVYPNPSKIFIPHCTILYRCGDDAGCCKFDSQTCVPKETNHVHLYFYVRRFIVFFIE